MIKSESAGPRPPAEIRKHDSLYYQNGDIVLLSLPKDDVITAFRVDAIFLSRYSPVFEGMFSLPSPHQDAVEKYDGVPLVRLHDEAQDLFRFLSALYDPRTVPSKKLNRDTPDQIAGMLKLSVKYEVEGLRMRIIEMLSSDWPKDLETWDFNQEQLEVILATSAAKLEKALYESSVPLDEYIDDLLPDPCAIIRLAREHDIPELLPAAFYYLSCIPSFADHNVPSDSPSYSRFIDHMTSDGRTARFSLLSRADLVQLARGIRSLSEFFQDMNYDDRLFAPSLCASPNEPGCKSAIRNLLTKYELTALQGRDGLQLLRGQDIFMPTEICNLCSLFFSQHLRNARADLWKRLPEMFGLTTGGI